MLNATTDVVAIGALTMAGAEAWRTHKGTAKVLEVPSRL